MIGKTIAHYEITSRLGKGGMGEVYQAKDRKLGRDVAIKVLPEEFARDTDRVARFQREAKLLASLNHPNIAAIYGLEASGETNFLVLELVEGQTLAERIKTGPVPVEEALNLALQIAEALEAAHEKGVIHRDLKPANIKITPDGKAKVLDFGLAKAFAGDQEEANLSNSPTLSDAATQQGVILGTAAYMSPEQARGKAVDKKADIWAFGCVLFEMLTGSAAFSGKDVTDILAAVIRAEPEWKTLPENLHWRLREVIERCLKKDARDRYHDISDVRVDIQKVLADPSGLLAHPAAPHAGARMGLPWIAAAIVLTAIIVGVAVWKMKPAPAPEPRPVVRLDYELPEGQQFSNLMLPALAVSHDGRQFIYSTGEGLYLRSVDALAAKRIAGTEGNTIAPFFSPDDMWVGYFSSGKLKKIAIGGGAPVVLCDVGGLPTGASWGADDTIVYGEVGRGILRISANGGTPETLAKGGVLGLPQILPDRKALLFTDYTSSLFRVMVQPAGSGEQRELFAGSGARYLPTGHIVYVVGNNLFAVLFNAESMEAAGGQVPLVEGVLQTIGVSQYAVSDSGTLVYIPGTTGGAASGRTLVWVDKQGKEEPLGAQPDSYAYPKVSPDGTRVALTVRETNVDIWVWDLVRKTLTRLTFDKASDLQSIWTPDGKRIVFSSGRDGSLYSLYWKAADGTGAEEKLFSMSDRALMPWCWSGDGKTLVMQETNLSSEWDIGLLSMEGDRGRKPLLHEDAAEIQMKVSPDGRWIAYMSTESGRAEVYVRPFPEVDTGKWQVSTTGGAAPLWSPDGRELFYLGEGNTVMAIAVETKPTFTLGTPKVLFKSIYVGAATGEGTPWDISADGKRFLMLKEAGATPSAAGGPQKINIVLNWTEELKQRVPIK